MGLGNTFSCLLYNKNNGFYDFLSFFLLLLFFDVFMIYFWGRFLAPGEAGGFYFCVCQVCLSGVLAGAMFCVKQTSQAAFHGACKLGRHLRGGWGFHGSSKKDQPGDSRKVVCSRAKQTFQAAFHGICQLDTNGGVVGACVACHKKISSRGQSRW